MENADSFVSDLVEILFYNFHRVMSRPVTSFCTIVHFSIRSKDIFKKKLGTQVCSTVIKPYFYFYVEICPLKVTTNRMYNNDNN